MTVVDFDRLALEVLHDGGDSLVDTAFQLHRISTGSDILQSRVENSLCQNGCRGGAVTSLIVGLGSHFLNHLSAHVLNGFLQLYLLGHGDTILRDLRSTEFLVDNDVTAFRS